MPTGDISMVGPILSSSSPTIQIELWGIWGPPKSPEFYEAVVDTGFTGGVSIPILRALPLGLALFSTANFTLADGSTDSTLLCLGMARMGTEERSTVFSLSKGNEILVGTEFLSDFGAKFELDYKTMTYSLVSQ